MVFNSLFFFLTLLPFLAVFALCRKRSAAATKVWLLAYSYFFYGLWNPAFLVLLVGSTLVDYQAARAMQLYPARRRLFLIASLVTNLGLLGFFKYWNFFVESAAWSASALGFEWRAPVLDVLLPVGISFYTFQTLSYTIDVYRGDVRARGSLLDVALYVAFFPQLVAGPILRASEFLPQVEDPPRIAPRDVADGALLVLFGLFLKSVVADNAAPHVDALFAGWQRNGILENWSAGMLFGVQIHGDFSGYSMVAIGLSRMLGYRMGRNFFSPYGAAGFSDFWRRWHISLSTWLRDYLYIPLGGNRGGGARTYVNLMLTMLLGGLWHGASVLFVVWGGLHGLYLCAERALRGNAPPRPSGVKRFLAALLTWLLVSITWIPFRAASSEQGFAMVRGLVSGPLGDLASVRWVLAASGLVFSCHFAWSLRDFTEVVVQRPWLRFAAALVFLLSLYYFSGERTEFIYFRF
jgi:D-alanyl-lipoteichoic acid acyltransferase DltB (MBOAT superfamily)